MSTVDRPTRAPERLDWAGAVRRSGIASGWTLLALALAATVAVAIGHLWETLLPLVLAILLSTVLWPVAAFLRRHRVPAAGAAVLSLLLLIGGLVGLGALVLPSVRDQFPDLLAQARSGVQKLPDLLKDTPFTIDQAAVDRAVEQVSTTLRANAGQIVALAQTGIGVVAGLVVTLVVTLVLTIYLLTDGDRFLPWTRRFFGRPGEHLAAVGATVWTTLGGFIRAQALIGLVDGIFIGLGLLILGVPLALVLGALTAVSAFVPIVGAVVAGGLAALVALVANGPGTALLVVVLVLAVQQVEGHVLQPILMGRTLKLTPAVVLLAITAGSTLFGIIGAFLAVPTVAVAADVARYVRGQLLPPEQPSAEPDEPTGPDVVSTRVEPSPTTGPPAPEPAAGGPAGP